jgi:hypothetical protein
MAPKPDPLAALAATIADVERRVSALSRSLASTKADTPKPAPKRPVQPAEVALTSFGLTTAPGIGPTAAERRAKADAEAEQARRDALPETVATWADRLTFAEREALAAVQSMFAANGAVPVAINRADLAAHLRTTPEAAEALLNKLCIAGAVERSLRFQSGPRYRPVASPPAPTHATKSSTPQRRPDLSALPRLRSALGVRPRQ